jgi:hypothetical protein
LKQHMEIPADMGLIDGRWFFSGNSEGRRGGC